ncbi:MAG: transcriptional regulator [Alphaproteobacteria bacterium]|nr:MAG: transcriptional regulator [Alphaproteobacteria bacterium]
MQETTRKNVRARLNRIEGQIRGIAGMVDADRYCIDVITQIRAVRAALKGVENEVLKDHMGHCVEHAITSGDRNEQRQKMKELLDLLKQL